MWWQCPWLAEPAQWPGTVPAMTLRCLGMAGSAVSGLEQRDAGLSGVSSPASAPLAADRSIATIMG